MNRIDEILKEKGIKQKWLSDETGISLTMINHYCHNRFQPKRVNENKIASVLGVTIEELIKEKE